MGGGNPRGRALSFVIVLAFLVSSAWALVPEPRDASAANVGSVSSSQLPNLIADFDVYTDRMTVYLDASRSYSLSGYPITQYWWGASDGFNSTDPVVTHTFAAPGRHQVRLSVLDAAGHQATADRYVSVADTTVEVVVSEMFEANCPYGDYWTLRHDTYGDVLLRNETPCSNSWPWVLFTDMPAQNPSFVNTLYSYEARVRNHPGYSLTTPVVLPVFGPSVPASRDGYVYLNWTLEYIGPGLAASLRGTPYELGSWVSADGFGTLLRGYLYMDLATSRRIFGVNASTPAEAQAWWDARTLPGREAGALERAFAAWLSDQGNGPYDVYNAFEWFLQNDITDLQAFVDQAGNTLIRLFLSGWGLEVLLARWSYWGNASYVEAVNAPYGALPPRGWLPQEICWCEDAYLVGRIGASLDLDFRSAAAYHLRAWASAGPDGRLGTGDDRPAWVFEPWLMDYVPRAGSGSPGSGGYPNSELRWYEGLTTLHATPGSYAYGQPYEYTYVPTRWRLGEGSSLTVRLPRINVTWYDPVNSTWDPLTATAHYATFDAPATLGAIRPAGDYFLWDVGPKVLSLAGPHDWGGTGAPFEGAPWIELWPGTAPYPVNSPPVAGFTVSPTSGTVDTLFSVDASASWDAEDRPDDLVVRWDWEGDGIWDTNWSYGKSGAVRYPSPGNYTITLQVRDTGGLTGSARVRVSVTPTIPPPGRLLERQGLVLGYGAPGSFDDGEVGDPTVLSDEGVYHMWYHGASGGNNFRIGHATSLDGRAWTRQGHVEFPVSDGYFQAYAEVIDIGTEYRMWYSAYDGIHYRIFAASSRDGLNWTRLGLSLDVGPAGSLEDALVFAPTVVYSDGVYRMWYSARASDGMTRILYATSLDGVSWVRHGVALDRGPPGSPEEGGVWAPTVRIVDGAYRMFYEGRSDTGRLFEAVSPNGLNWTRLGMVLDVLAPDEGVVSLPAFLPDRSGMWLVYYTARPYLYSTVPGLRIYLATRVAAEPGLLRVTTSIDLHPEFGVPGKVLVDGIPRDEWGLAWLKIEPGRHVVSFSDVPGLGTPWAREIDVVADQVTEVVGTYQAYGWLRVTTDPAVPATISIDGIPRDDWGVWMALEPGVHEVSFGPVDGYRPPRPQTVTVVPEQLTHVVGSYRRSPGARGPDPATYGLLRVETALDSGRLGVPTRVLVDGIPRDEWGLAWLKIEPGVHAVSFTDVPGLGTPAPIRVGVYPGATTVVRGVFQVHGWLRVTTDPPVPGTIFVDGIPRDDWGMWQSLPQGRYAVAFGPVPGYETPPPQNVTVQAGQLTWIVGRYRTGGPSPGENWTVRALVLDVGGAGGLDDRRAFTPAVLRDDDGSYKMWYTGYDGYRNHLLFATSRDGVNWTKRGEAIPLLTSPWYFDGIYSPFAMKENGTYHLWFAGTFWRPSPVAAYYNEIYHAWSPDAVSWTVDGVALGLGPVGSWDDGSVYEPSVVRGPDGRLWMYYAGWDTRNVRIGLAFSDSYVGFTRFDRNPILVAGPPGLWDSVNVHTPEVVPGNPWRLYYGGYDGTRGATGVAYSVDGFRWTKDAGNPVLPGGPSGSWYTSTGSPSYVASLREDRLYFNGFDGATDRIGYATREAAPPPPPPEPALRIGVVLPLSGPLAVFGEDMVRAARLAVAQVNAQGGLGGRPIELLVEDSATSPVVAREAAWRLIYESNVSAIIGGAASSESLAILDVTKAVRIPQISPSSTSPVLTTADDLGVFLRTVPSDALEGRTAAWQEYVERGYRRVAVLWASNAYGRGVSKAFEENFTFLGGTVAISQAFAEFQISYLADLERIFAYDFDSVYLVAYPLDAERILSEWWANRGIWPTNWLLSGGLREEQLFVNLASLGVNVSAFVGVSARWPVDPDRGEYRLFREGFVRAYGTEPGIFAPHAYDAVFAVALAALVRGSAAPLAILGGLWDVDNGPGVTIRPTEWGRALEAVASSYGIDYSGAASFFTLDVMGDVGADYEIWAVDSIGRIVTVAWIPEAVVWP